MQRLLFAAVLALGAAALSSSEAADKKAKEAPKEAPIVAPKEGKSETLQLFNGKNLDGWEGNEKLWSVQDGVIVGKNADPVKVSTYLTTKRKFSDFRLLATVKLVDGGPKDMHSGIAVWGRLAPEKGDPNTYMPQLLGNITRWPMYMGHLVMFPSNWGMYDLHRRNGLPVDAGPAKKVGKQKDWNDLEILTQGNRIRVAVNGTQVIDWRDPQPDLIAEGPIGLQLHANAVPQEIHFKNLTLTTFPEDKLTTVK
jgi:hypothetical protein